MFKQLKVFKNFFFWLIIFLFFVFIASRGYVYDKDELVYGITFSQKQAENLGLDWKKTFLSALDDLGAKKVRLSAYWDKIESDNNNFSWDDLDWQIDQAGKRKVEVILALGSRLPRWPECHFPSWAGQLGEEERRQETMQYIDEVINRYREKKQIVAWQVENEPFLSHFGDCPELDKNFLDKEIARVHLLDSRPVIVTDSGELSLWIPAARRADIFGTTMYRDTYSAHLKRYIHYPIGPGFFRFKKNITDLFASPKKWIVIELQAEPWAPVPYQNITKEERGRTMDPQKFKDILEFSRQTGFREFYLWGVEWWYWEKEVNKDEGMWKEAQKLFN